MDDDPPTVGLPAPADARASVPKTLKRARFTTLTALVDALIPPGGTIADAGADLHVAERLDASMASWDAGARRMFERALGFFEWQTLFSRSLRRFSQLAPDAGAAAVERALHSRLAPKRAAADMLKFYCLNQFAASPRVEERIGYTYACVTSDPPNQAPPLEVVQFPQISRDHVEECDVVVIGSGAGGSVVAKELAETGLSVVVLEEGGSYSRTDFTGPPFERFQKLYRRQGMTAALGRPAVPLPMGMGVGGSTLVNSGTCFRTPDRVLMRWAKDGLDGVDPDSMRGFFDRVERVQHVKPVPEELLGENARVIRRGAQRMGLNGRPLLRNIEGCRGCGTCAFGCPSDAKLATHLTYLPRAQRHGATIYANTRAERIVIEGGRAQGVVASLLDPRTRETRATLTVHARLVVVAAGAIHTPALLAANALGNRSGQLGRNLRIHPAAGVGGFFTEDVFGWRGTLQPFFIDDFHESHDLMIEVTSSIPSIGAGTLPGAGAQWKELLAAYPKLASAGLFVSDTSSGRVRGRGPGREPLVTYRLNEHDTRRLVRGMAIVSEILLEAGARGVLSGLPGLGPVTSKKQLEDLKEEAVKRGALKLTAFHPVGTARMGADPAASVTDPWGEVHGVQGLYVADASVLPGCPTVNPQITIMAFATRTSDHVVRHGGRYF